MYNRDLLGVFFFSMTISPKPMYIIFPKSRVSDELFSSFSGSESLDLRKWMMLTKINFKSLRKRQEKREAQT